MTAGETAELTSLKKGTIERRDFLPLILSTYLISTFAAQF